MQAVQRDSQEPSVVTGDDVTRAQAESVAAKERLAEAQGRLVEIVKHEERLNSNLKTYGLIKRIRQFSDQWTTRIGGAILFVMAPTLLVLVLCNLVGLRPLYWTLPLLVALAASGFYGAKFFRPDDAKLNSDLDSWTRELQSVEGEKWSIAAEVSDKKSILDAADLKYRKTLDRFESRINQLRSEHWKELKAERFENFLADVFREWGYDVQTTKTTGDQGVDLIISKGGVKTAVQTKGYVSSVGNDAIQQAHTGKSIYRCQRCAVITNSTFTPSARQAAEAVGCVLVDEEQIPLLIDGQLRL
jgi:HJR/Mrr/RecB family endonuclease